MRLPALIALVTGVCVASIAFAFWLQRIEESERTCASLCKVACPICNGYTENPCICTFRSRRQP
jgi:hypothetical protein